MVELPKNEDVLTAALHQANGRIGKEAATYVEHLIKKTKSEKGFVEKVFDDKMMANYNRAKNMLLGKDQNAYTRIYHTKLSQAEREDYDLISDYKRKETDIHNAEINIETTLGTLEAAIEVSKQLQDELALIKPEASITAEKK